MITTEPLSDDPLCSADPELWDLDHGSLIDWLAALQVCTVHCPMAAACRRYTLDQIKRGKPPLGLVQSGVVFTAAGRPLEPHQLAEYAARMERRQAADRAA